jgi:hypothetical protein
VSEPTTECTVRASDFGTLQPEPFALVQEILTHSDPLPYLLLVEAFPFWNGG